MPDPANTQIQMNLMVAIYDVAYCIANCYDPYVVNRSRDKHLEHYITLAITVIECLGQPAVNCAKFVLEL